MTEDSSNLLEEVNVPSYPEQSITGQIIAAAVEVHRALGPGLLESVYQACLARELQLRNVDFRAVN